MKRKISCLMAILVMTVFCTGSTVVESLPLPSEHTLSPEIQQTIDLINRSSNGIPTSVTRKQLQAALEQGGSNAETAFLHAIASARPIDMPMISAQQEAEMNDHSNSEDSEDRYVLYDIDTKTTEILNAPNTFMSFR